MFKSQKVGAIIVAAGRGERMGGIDKIFAPLGGTSVLERVARVFEDSPYIDYFVIVLNQDNVARGKHLLAGKNLSKLAKVVPGGVRRQDSVESGLKTLPACKWVVIHDGARPLVGAELITRGLEAAQETGAAVAAVPVIDTVKLVDEGGYVKETLNRSRLWAVQTPQVFRFDIIKEGYDKASGDVTDDAALVEAIGIRVKLYMGAYDNIKLTTPADLNLVEALWLRKEG
ncbi:MAG: 2-C-methyl-D-erythritol 4-phosphate cytidylyltransferase [Dehalococcoidia bacterium]|nr:MAG: 2-C-methyl-D-erythritol 4-phosphate cytidylyltransferase [Dehalococcoidia bacterium]